MENSYRSLNLAQWSKANSYSSSALHPKHSTDFSYLQPGDHQISNNLPWIFHCCFLHQHHVPCNSQDKHRSSILTVFSSKPDTIRPESWPQLQAHNPTLCQMNCEPKPIYQLQPPAQALAESLSFQSSASLGTMPPATS